MKQLFTALLFSVLFTGLSAAPAKVYVFPIRENIMPSTVKLTDKCLAAALKDSADYVIIDMNTYGGLMDAADSVRTALLNFPKPVMVFINNQAASAGALIAIAADSVYMREGASMGAATVVDSSGDPVPDKYQSFMRSMMRATAESHGKVVDRVRANGDTVWRWHRDPRVAEAMVDPTLVVPGLVDSLKVVTLTASEAIKWHYCEGKASSVADLLAKAGITDYQITEYKPTAMDNLLGWLTNPALQGILIMLIIGGIYFELQTPGIGFALVVSVCAAALYFAPLYIEGLASNWEIALFIAGVILLILEIFVTPGFGVLGILGIAAIVGGLAAAMIDLSLLKYFRDGQLSVGYLLRPFGLVITSILVAACLCIWLGPKFLQGESRLKNKVVLVDEMTPQAGYVSRAADRGMVGAHGTVTAVLRPAGRIEIGGVYYEAAGEDGQFIDKGAGVTVVRDEGGVLYCRKA
ncbi:MAG: nodulation protein NfeD [Rikenellaceae bacterium]|jgi:membrane-bound serine protease (ClpP class)|nr:nodulation protein NfeD [Rikenellaceae bacterium]